jgi:tetratricopeptide (TPR) repeat protein
MQRLRPQHVTALIVAAACVALALSNGGFDPSGFGTAALVVWALVIVALAVGLVPRSEPPKPAIAAGLCLAGLSVLTALSMLWGSDNGHAFEDVVRVLFYLGAFVLVVLASGRGDAGPWIRGLAIGLVAIGAIALLGRFEPSLFGHPDVQIADRLPAALGRLTYPIGYWNGLAAAMATGVALLTWLAARAGSRGGRIAATAAIPTILLALWMTGSRGGLIAAGLGVAALLATSRKRSQLLAGLALGALGGAIAILVVEGYDELRTNPVTALSAEQGDRMLAVLLAVTAATALARRVLDLRFERIAVSRLVGRVALGSALAAIVVAIALSDPVERFDEFKAAPTGHEISADKVSQLRIGGSGRYQFWKAALQAFESAPVAGVGSAGYTPYWLQHRDLAIPATRAHSLLFETLAELGLLGISLVLGFFAVATVAASRRLRQGPPGEPAAAALAVLTVGFAASAVDWTWDLPAVFGPTILAAALLTGPATLALGPEGAPGALGTARSRRRFGAGVALLVVAWLSVCASGLLLLADRRIEASRDAFARGDLDSALDAAEDAASIEPWAAEPHTQLALIRERAGEIEQARAEIGEAIDRAPRDYKLYLIATRLEDAAGDATAAQASFSRAEELNPKDPTLGELAGFG